MPTVSQRNADTKINKHVLVLGFWGNSGCFLLTGRTC